MLCLLPLQRQECNFRTFIFFIGLVVVTYSITLCCGSTRFGLSHICLNPSTLRHFSGAHRPPIKIFSKDNSRYSLGDQSEHPHWTLTQISSVKKRCLSFARKSCPIAHRKRPLLLSLYTEVQKGTESAENAIRVFMNRLKVSCSSWTAKSFHCVWR